MRDFFDILFGSGNKPVRRDANVRLTVDRDGRPIVAPVAGEAVTLSPEGSIDRVILAQDRFFHCGCTAEAGLGGQCGQQGCNRLSCQRCFSHCQVCNCPLCLEHRRRLTTEAGTLSLCPGCYSELKRKRWWRALGRVVVRPFVEFPDRNDS